jgi:hypothetical protein
MVKTKAKGFLNERTRKLIPPRKMNYNWSGSKINYQRDFLGFYALNVFPYFLSKTNELQVSTKDVTLLDIGCGWGPAAAAFAIYSEAMKGLGNFNYLGIDIREDAIGWLKKAYADYPHIQFQHHSAEANVDYIGEGAIKNKTIASSTGIEAKFNFAKGFQHNWQWSSSVFTHLTPEGCREALRSIRQSCSTISMQLNTWLIIDEQSRYSLATGTADRVLPYDSGDFLTYSEKNPLVCTCYKMEVIERLYSEAGLEIVQIDRGSWRGPNYKNSAQHYQDIVISRPK